MTTVDVGVLFRNNRDLVDPFFFFLKAASSGVQTRVIAIDQESSDGTLDAIRRHTDPIAGLHRGIASGRNNILRRRSPGRHLLLVDSDVFFARHDAIAKMVDAIESNVRVGVAYCPVSSFYTGKVETGFCCAMLSSAAIGAVGQFDERFQMFYDDSDYFNRMTKLGFCASIPLECLAVHVWGSTTHTGSEGFRKQECLASDGAEYEKKWK